MLSIFKLVLTILSLMAVAALINAILNSNARTQNLLIGATVFCSVMFATFVWALEFSRTNIELEKGLPASEFVGRPLESADCRRVPSAFGGKADMAIAV